MAYGLQYIHNGTNDLNQDIEITLSRKDTPAITPIPFILEGDIEMDDDTDEGCIIARSLVFSIHADDDTPVDWETFLSDNTDEWLVKMTVDTLYHFEGFIVPEEGNRPLFDKPYPIKLTCTNGLKLLKDVPLSDQSGAKYKGTFSLINYISTCLSKLGLNLPIRIYSSVYEHTYINRAANISADMFQQTYLNSRSFQADAVTPNNCYDTLFFILGKVHRLFYWNGRWVIEYVADHQNAPLGRYYTDYAPDGSVTGGALEPVNYGQVGKAQLIYPINENPALSSSFAIKSARTPFDYIIWPELPLNNKFERGTYFDQGQMNDIYDQDNDGNTSEIVGIYKRFTIDDWFYGLNTGPTSNTNLPILQPTAAKAYRRSIYNKYGIELIRELQLNASGDPFTSEKWLQSEGIPVRYGDKIKIDYNFRTDVDTNNTVMATARLYIVATNGKKVSLRWDANELFGKWLNETGPGAALNSIILNYTTGDDTSKYTTVSVESNPIPVDGVLYIVLGSSNAGAPVYYSGFNFEYIPYVAGGYVPVKGDYWLRGQNKSIPDVEDEPTQMSDSGLSPVKGCMVKVISGKFVPTDPSWYRYGITETRHYKELINLARFNLRARRFWNVQGEFSSIDMEPENNQLGKLPIGYQFNYLFPDFPQERFFVLTPPLSMNVSAGTINATFDEIINPANATMTMDKPADKMIAAINATSIATWQSQGLAPATGTPGFPPAASTAFLGNQPRDFYLFVPLAAVPTYAVSANGAGNNPTLTELSQSLGPFKWLHLRFGADIAVGNRYTITIFGVSVTIEIEEREIYDDGNNLGDFSEFNYIFDK